MSMRNDVLTDAQVDTEVERLNVSFQRKISEKEFMEDYERCKRIVDSGISECFVLLNSKSFDNVSTVDNTTLKDIEDVFGEGFLPMMRFADIFDCGGTVKENTQSGRIRRMAKADIKTLRGMYKFFPKDCFVFEWTDATGFRMILPFMQKENGEITFLGDNPLYRCDRKKVMLAENTLPKFMLKTIVGLLPDYCASLFAIVNYKGVDMIIPIEKKTAKVTFKNRDKTDGTKRHLIHDVKEYGRKNLKTVDSVRYHLRGTSDFTINGIDIKLCGSMELSASVMKKGNVYAE